MSWATFFPADTLSFLFVVIVIAWFIIWIARLSKEAAYLNSAPLMLKALDKCIAPLRSQLQWRDRQRLQGSDMGPEPGALFDSVCQEASAATAKLPPVIKDHFRAIFVAGCEESQLDTAELNAQTCRELGAKSEQYGYELLLILLAGGLGTLLALSRRFSSSSFISVSGERALPPLIWGILLAIAGGIQLLRHRQLSLLPALTELRHKTSRLWVPKLYPTVAQRAAQWAIHTLHNAARVTDASEVIEKHAVRFVSSVESAHQAAEKFSEGMREFSRGMGVSDQALQNAQTTLANEVKKFSDSLARWGQFEDEIRRFYSAMESHQHQITSEHRAFETMLSGYQGFVRESTNMLQKAASDITIAAGLLPEAFNQSADTMARSTAESRSQMMGTVEDLGGVIQRVYREESAQLLANLQTMLQPVLNMEERLRALSTPFDQASKNMLEIANNIWRLNDSLTAEVRKFMADSEARDGRAAKAGL